MRYGSISLIFAAIAISANARTPQPQVAASDSTLVDALMACRAVTDPGARVACYDTNVDKLHSAKEQGDLVVMDREDIQKTKRSLFGFDIGPLPIFGSHEHQEHEKSEKSGKSDEITEITAQIRSVREAGYGIYTMVLDQGGVWQTTENPDNVPDAGDPIHIKRGVMGGYMANIHGARAVRIRRIG